MPAEDEPDARPGTHGHEAHGKAMADCPECLLKPAASGSARIAWAIAVVSVLLLVGFFLLGSNSPVRTLTGASGLVLLAVLACPLTMGAMMWMMMRKRM